MPLPRFTASPVHSQPAALDGSVAGLAQSAAATYGHYNIRGDCVTSGLIRTPMTQALVKNKTSLKLSAALHPLDRIGEPDEVASAIRWFLSPEKMWVTG